MFYQISTEITGGSIPRPGEISLAHHGVLFLDELPEFDRRVLESLREPLESGSIHVARAGRHAVFPARFQLVAAMNPCPCGYLGHPTRACKCTPDQVSRYRSKLSGPFLDRIDIAIDVTTPTEAEMQTRSNETSASVRARVAAARARQLARQGCSNAALDTAMIEQHCITDAAGQALLQRALGQLALSARAYHRVLRLARTIADLADSDSLSAAHIAEAIQYRRPLSSA